MLPKRNLIWLLMIICFNSRAQEFIKNPDSAKAAFLQQTNIEEKANTAFAIGENYWAIRKLPLAKQWFNTSLQLAPVATDSNNVINTLHLLANVHLNGANYDSALFYCNEGFRTISQISNQYFLANLYQTKGSIYLSLGDQYSAISYFTIADSLYNTSPYPELQAISPYIKISLGKIFSHQRRMDRAKEYFDLALQLSQSQKSNNAEASSLQTIANWYCEMEEFNQARSIYYRLLQPPLLNHHSYRMIYIYIGLGDVYLGLNKPDSSLRYYRLGTNEAEEKGEKYQQDLFYSKIGDAYLKLRNISLAKLYYDSTLYWGEKNNNYTASVNAYRSLAEIAITENDYQTAYRYQELKQQLADSALNLKNMEMSNNLYTLNNIKQKDAAINTLTELDRDNKKIIKQSKLIAYLLFGFVGLVVLSFWGVLNRLKLKRRLEKQLAITTERERIITDLHDDVGATLSSMHIYSELAGKMVETKPAQSIELMQKISQQGKDLLGRMSDIIWSLKPAGEERYSFSIRLKNYSQELLSGKGIKAEFDIDETLNSRIINPLIRKNILLVAKEAMNNIAKYSNAATAVITLLQLNGFIELTITDDGIGFDMQTATGGNGLHNIRQRSQLLKGNCNIISSPGNGTQVQCKFPIANISHTG